MNSTLPVGPGLERSQDRVGDPVEGFGVFGVWVALALSGGGRCSAARSLIDQAGSRAGGHDGLLRHDHPRGVGSAQPSAPAAGVVGAKPSSLFAASANSLVKVLARVTFETSVPMSFSIA